MFNFLTHGQAVQKMFDEIQVIYSDNDAPAYITCHLCGCDTDAQTICDESIMLSGRDDVEANALHFSSCPIQKYREDEWHADRTLDGSYHIKEFMYA